MNKNILITGGAGFIGSNLALKLIKNGHNITVMDNLSKQIHGEGQSSPLYLSIKDKVNFIKADVRDAASWDKALEGQDVVVHLAAETGTGQSMYEIEQYVDVNIQGTACLLHHLTNKKHSIKKVVVASSRAVYGEGKYNCPEHGIVYPNERKEKDLIAGQFECTCPVCDKIVSLLPTTEDSMLHPTSVYGITKQNQEQMVLTVCGSIGIDAIAYRYQNVYGPGQSLSNPYTGILSIFSTQIKNGNQINIFEDGKESRDFVYIDDVVDATVLGIETENVHNDVFNVGADKPIDVITVAQTLIEKYNSDANFEISGNFRLGDIRHNYADTEKIKSLLGYEPKYNFSKGISNFAQWVNTQAVQKDKYKESIDQMKKRGLFK